MLIYLIPLSLFKGLIFCSGTFIANFINGYSGVALYQGYYYAMYPATLTTITICGFLIFDQSFSKNPSKFNKTSTDVQPHTNPNYDPKSYQPLSLTSLFNRDSWLASNGISTNSDGSTNNLTDYFVYVRDSWIKNITIYFVANMAWGFLCGLVLFYFSFYAMSGIILKNG